MKKKIVVLVLLTFSVVVTPLVVNNVYYIPQIAIMSISPFVLIRMGLRKSDGVPLLLAFFIVCLSLAHPSSFRYTTVIYSVLFITTYIYYTKLIEKSNFSITDFQSLIKFIIIAYAIVLIIQITMTLLGLEPINESYGTDNRLKFNSLSYEASQVGPVITLLMFAYIRVEEIKHSRKLKFNELLLKNIRIVFFLYLFVSIFSLSVTGFFSLLILLLYFVSGKHIVIGLTMLILVVVSFFFMGTEIGNRILIIMYALPSMDVRMIYEADPSASARLVPPLLFIKEFDLFSLNTWVGNGCDYGHTHVWRILIDNDNAEAGDSMAVLGLLSLIYDYGLLAFIMMMKFVHSLCKFKSFVFFLFVTCFFTSSFNMYSIWLFFMVIYTLNFFNKQISDKRNLNYFGNVQYINNP